MLKQRTVFLFGAGALLLALPLHAQQDRLHKAIDNSRRVTLKGHRNPQATQKADRGAVDPSRRIEGMTFLLKSSPEQEKKLASYLDELQNPASPNYHNWLTPEEFANRFALSVNDYERIVSWLTSEGFRVDYKARGRNSINFSGTAAQVQRSFRTTLHVYKVDGEDHYANSTDPSVPADLEPFIQVIQGLDDFRLKPRARVGKPIALFTNTDGNHFITPGDMATIYNIFPLYARGIDGSGQKIIIVGQTDFKLSDVQAFRTRFGLSTNDPQKILVPGFPNPGIIDDEGEAILDVEYSGGIAPGATILYVYSTNVYSSVGYAIDQNLAPVLSMSYGGCEPKVSSNPSGSAAAIRSLAQQAAAQGITWVASSGDSGAAGCERQQVTKAGVNGPAVELPASVPEVTAVGGTEFFEGSTLYWNANTAANGASAKSYIPEIAWNNTSPTEGLASTGGGASVFFTKPVWQTGTGVPNDNARDVPDVSLNASFEHDNHIVFLEGALHLSGGTSAAAPSFAGMLALLNQSVLSAGGRPGLGNINPNLYRLAQTNPSVFHDITIGTNIVPCTSGSTGCGSSGQYGFTAGAGYDRATGLGSVDANALVTQWSGAGTTSQISTSTSVAASPSSIQVNASTSLTATVRAASGNASPQGSVSFNLGKTALGTVNLSGSSGTSVATLVVFGSRLASGSNAITVSYGGSTSFSASVGSATVSVTVPVTTSAVVPSVVPSPVYQQDADEDGFSFFFTVRLTEIGGTASTLTGFAFGSVDYSDSIADFFGSAILPARGTLSAALRARNLTVPVDRVFTFSGVDATGSRWSQQLTVTFLSKQIAASVLLTSAPSTETQNPAGDPNCDAGYPYYQQLNLQEQNGVGLTLTKFIAGGFDLTSSIQDYFGGYRLAPLGALRANICWRINNAPTTLNYEVDGTDTSGNTITTTTSVLFQGPGQSPGALSASKSSVRLTAAPSQSTTSSLTVNVPAGQKWSVSLFPANQKSSWLVVFPQSGTGSTQVNLVASAAGLPNGVYNASLVFQSANTIPQFFNTAVTLVIGSSSSIVIGGVANGASFDTSASPGMVLSVFGTRLANSVKGAASVPLPTILDGVSATVNGVSAPLYFISPGQLNVQVPYETPAGTATLGVNNNGQVASFTFPVSATAPGMFTGGNGALVPIGSAARGQAAVLFMTGEGDTLPGLATGAPPAGSTPVSQLPAPRQPVSMTIGGIAVKPFFVGIPYGLVGVTQVNFSVPANAPLGLQPVVVAAGGRPSKAAALNITAAAADPGVANPFLSLDGSGFPGPRFDALEGGEISAQRGAAGLVSRR